MFPIEKIVDYKGPVTSRCYLIKWFGYGDDATSWEPRSHVPAEMITKFEKSSEKYVKNPKFRCDVCV